MISSIRGQLKTLHEGSAIIDLGPIDIEVLIPEFVRRQLQDKIGKPIELCTSTYLDGNPQKGGRMVPRMIGFTTPAEQEFLELICSVDGFGVKKALQALIRPVRDIAAAIEQRDTKFLSTLPGIGPAVAERIVAKLRRKMTRFALMANRPETTASAESADVLNDVYEALIALGHAPADAREKMDQTIAQGEELKTVEEFLQAIYMQEYQS